jgi:hypothetical protein
MDLIALRRMTYATRRLLPGDRFNASPGNARVLIAVKKAKSADEAVVVEASGDDLTIIRRQYHDIFGKQPFHGWDAETLLEKIAEAKGSN